MTDWYSPNQQAVRADGSGAAEVGNGGGTLVEPPAEVEPQPADYDPSDHTVFQVEDYVTAFPDRRASVLAAEKAGKNRATLVDWLASD